MWVLLALACGGRPAEKAAPASDSAPPASETADSAPVDDSASPSLPDDMGLPACVAAVEARGDLGPLPGAPAFWPVSNGHVAAVYARQAVGVPVRYNDGSSGLVDQTNVVSAFFDFPSRAPTATTVHRDRLWDLYPGLRVDGAGAWVTGAPPAAVAYEDGTGILAITNEVGGLRLTARLFAPFAGEDDLAYVLTVENLDSRPHTVSLYTLQNLHTGGEGAANGEAIAAVGGALLESRGADAILHRPLDPPSAWAAAPAGHPSNPYGRLLAGQDLDGGLVSGDDLAVGTQWELGALDPGASATRGLLLSLGEDPAALAARVEAFVGGRDAAALLDAERADWAAFQARARPVDLGGLGLAGDPEALYRQSLAMLRMAQLREGPGAGLILASLPPGIWSIPWPRDQAYATLALVRAGLVDEAAAAIDAILAGEAGAYAPYLGVDDYLVSVCRYTADGVEESDGATCPDGSEAGPNIELDGFGLFLRTYAEVAAAMPADWRAARDPRVQAGVVDVLGGLVDLNGMLVADSSIWERHWEDCFPNGRKHFVYSTLHAASGLSALGEDALAARLHDEGLLRWDVDGGPVYEEAGCPILASAPEETCAGCGPDDLSVADAVAFGVIDPSSALSRGTLARLDAALGMPNGPGLRRGDDGSGSANPYPWYDDQEWLFADLTLARALFAAGDALPGSAARGQELLSRVSAVGAAMGGQLPELLSDGVYTAEDDADGGPLGVDAGGEAQGAIPMIGFGAGLYVLTALERGAG